MATMPPPNRPLPQSQQALSRFERRKFRLIDEAGFFTLPSEAGKPAKGAADYRRYTITVEEQGRRHTVKASDPLDDPKLRNLIGFLQRKVREMRQPAKP
jgi:hypothetical protein